MSKEEILKSTLKRTFILWQIFRICLEDLRTSDAIKELAQKAKENKNKSFVDLREVAAQLIRSLDAFILKTKGTMSIVTFNEIMKHLNNEQMKEIAILLDEVTELSEESIESLHKTIRNYRNETE